MVMVSLQSNRTITKTGVIYPLFFSASGSHQKFLAFLGLESLQQYHLCCDGFFVLFCFAFAFVFLFFVGVCILTSYYQHGGQTGIVFTQHGLIITIYTLNEPPPS